MQLDHLGVSVFKHGAGRFATSGKPTSEGRRSSGPIPLHNALNIHSAASFYDAFDAERARELSRRVEFCYTPVHGSWLNMAEIEISVLARQCLGKRRVPNAQTLGREARAWYEARNRQRASVDWRFTTADTRTKLRRLYPSIED
jgi:hypothetical protein